MAFESEISKKMFTNGGFRSQIGNNCVKPESRFHPTDNKHSHIDQASKSHRSTSVKSSFIKRFNPFSKSKSQTINCNSEHERFDDKEFASVKVLKQFWNDQIKTAKSTEHLNRNQKSATIKFFTQSNESLNDPPRPNRAEKSLTLDGRLPVEEFNKFKDADFVRNKKSHLKYIADIETPAKKTLSSHNNKYLRIESFASNDSHFPQVSATGGKLHWARRTDILKTKNLDMSVKSNMVDQSSSESCETKCRKDGNQTAACHELKRESISSSVGSTSLSVTSNANSASRKFSFKTAPSTTASYMNKKISASSNGTKVAQIAQRFNQMIQQDATILEEVKKRGSVVLHRSGGCVIKIKEEKVDCKHSLSYRRSADDASDDAASLPSIGKNSTRKKSSLKKRPSIRILVESPRKDGKSGNVLSKKQLYETNIVNKETIVLKPKVPDKSERVLAKTKELKIKKINGIEQTETASLQELTASMKLQDKIVEDDEPCEVVNANPLQLPLRDHKKNNFQKIYDKISFRPTFIYGKKVIKHEATVEAASKAAKVMSSSNHDDISKETEDEMEFQDIDLNLNVYFHNENLSESHKTVCEDNGNTITQGCPETATQREECKHEKLAADMKPNESFLFRTQSGCKFEAACDAFIRDMLSEPTVELQSFNNEISKSESSKNNYEVILTDVKNMECVNVDKSDEENIYQSLSEVKGETESIKSYESFENYDEIAQNILDNKICLSDLLKVEDDYIISEKAPEPPPPRKNTVPRISSPILTYTTSNLVQTDLKVPKLKYNHELKKSNSCASTTYEKINYDRLPAISQQQNVKLRLPPRNDEQLPHSDENIYDTIKNGDNRSLIISNDLKPFQGNKEVEENSESFNCGDDCENPYKNSKNDTMSIISNCYESINLKQNYSTINQILRHAISTTTLSSEHRINSIYGTMVGQSLTPPSDRSASDNSDEWIDLSDEENELTDNRFVV